MKTDKQEERVYKCSVCKAVFSDLGLLRAHHRTHSRSEEVAPNKCDRCDANFLARKYLLRHIRRSHIHPSAHPCPHCSARFPEPYELRRHIRVHTGEKGYKCNICHEKFSQKGNLRRHARIHTEQRLHHQCPTCRAQFTRSDTLRHHLRTAHSSQLTRVQAGNAGTHGGCEPLSIFTSFKSPIGVEAGVKRTGGSCDYVYKENCGTFIISAHFYSHLNVSIEYLKHSYRTHYWFAC